MSSWQRKRPGRPSHATVVAYAALFVALTGTAWAAATIGPGNIKDDAVRSKHIKDGQVKKHDLHANSVVSGKIADGTVSTSDIGDGQVGSADVADESLTSGDLGQDSVGSSEVIDNSLTSADLGPDSVGSSEVAANSLTSADLGAGSVGQSELGANSVRASEIGDAIVARPGTPVNVAGGVAENGAYTVNTATAACNAGEELISGAGHWTPDDNASGNLELWIAEIRPNFAAESVVVDGGNDSGADHTLTAVAICMQA